MKRPHYPRRPLVRITFTRDADGLILPQPWERNGVQMRNVDREDAREPDRIAFKILHHVAGYPDDVWGRTEGGSTHTPTDWPWRR